MKRNTKRRKEGKYNKFAATKDVLTTRKVRQQRSTEQR